MLEVYKIVTNNTNKYEGTGFYRVTVCEGGIGSRNSVCPSVCLSHTSIVTNLNGALQIF